MRGDNRQGGRWARFSGEREWTLGGVGAWACCVVASGREATVVAGAVVELVEKEEAL
jgi:hypothetical protein